MAFSARLLRFLCVFILFIVLTPLSAFAQNNQQPYIQAEQTSKQIQILFVGFSGTAICALSGVDIFHPGYNCLGQKMHDPSTSTSQKNTQSFGALGLLTSGIGALYQKPVSSEESIKYLASNFGIAKQTLAQEGATGGFQSFSFMQDMFLTIRNISFLLLVFAFILIGIAIMLRFKIDPRTVMTLQNQIPKIIVAIVMITFSYSIAGALVDGMWLVTYFGINTIAGVSQEECGNGGNGSTFAGIGTQQLLNNPIAFTSHVFSDAGCQGTFDGIGGLSYDIGFSMSDGITGAITQAIGMDQRSDLDCGLGISVGPISIGGGSGSVGDCIQKGIYSFLTWLISIIAFLIVLIAIFIALIRLWITLVKAYVYIILDVLTAPLQILIGILPGGRMGFTRWLRHITGYLLLFPASAVVIFLALAFSLNPKLNQESVDPTQVFFPPLIGVPGSSGKIGYLIAFGLIMLLPEILDMIKEAMQIKGNPRVSTAIVGGFSRGVGPSQALGGLGGGLFGKDKNGVSRAPRRMVEQKWMHSTLPDTLLGGGKYSPLRLWRRSADNQRQAAYQHQQQNRAYSFTAANEAYHSMMAMTGGDKLRSGARAAEVLQRGTYSKDYISNHLQKNYGLSSSDVNKVWEKVSPTPPPTPTSGHSPATSGHTPTSTDKPIHTVETAAPGGTSTVTGAGTSAPHTIPTPPGHTTVGGAATTTNATVSTPHEKVKWFGNDLKKEDGSGNRFATRNAIGSVFTPAGEIDSQPMNKFADWLKRKGFEEV